MPSVCPATSVPGPDGGEGRVDDAEPPIGLSIGLVHEAGEWPALAKAAEAIEAAAAALSAELGLKGCEACVALSSDAEVAKLNAAYRGKAAPTNVLSFPAITKAGALPSPEGFLGDVVLAEETLDRESAELGVQLDHHLQHLVVHGLLHLLGFDHDTEERAEAMEGLEVRVLACLGVANPYTGAEEPTRRQEIAKP